MMHVLKEIAGVELPSYIGTLSPEAAGANGTNDTRNLPVSNGDGAVPAPAVTLKTTPGSV